MMDPEYQTNHGYAKLYENIAFFPELGRFRRLGPHWAKLNHDNTEEVIYYAKRLQEELSKKIPTLPAEHGVGVLSIARNVVKIKHPKIYKKFWKPYEGALRRYGRDLCISQQIMNLPEHAPFATRHLRHFGPPVFENGRFGITRELDEFYLGPSNLNDACGWIAQKDFLTERFGHIAAWIDAHIWRRFFTSKARRAQRESEVDDPPYLPNHLLVGVMDVLTCILVSGLLMGAMFALYRIKSSTTGIGVVGALGVVFSISVKILASQSRRIEVCAATAAFFAVAVVFVASSGVAKTGT